LKHAHTNVFHHFLTVFEIVAVLKPLERVGIYQHGDDVGDPGASWQEPPSDEVMMPMFCSTPTRSFPRSKYQTLRVWSVYIDGVVNVDHRRFGSVVLENAPSECPGPSLTFAALREHAKSGPTDVSLLCEFDGALWTTTMLLWLQMSSGE
jgi:hypothetical protein